MKKLLFATTCLALTSTASMAADMGVPYSKAPVMAAPVFSWTGCYIGAHIGGGMMTANTEANGTSQNGTGAVAGGQGGCNYQDGNWVFGVEGEGYWSNIKVHSGFFDSPTDLGNFNTKNTADYTIAGRVGITFDRTLIYGKAGWAWGSFKSDSTCCNATSLTTTQNGDLNGPLVGIGLEHALTRNWTIKAEYNYIAYGNRLLTVNCPACTSFTPFTENASATKQIFKFGANYLFDIGGAPVVAKY